MDLEMPGMDGFEAASAVRTFEDELTRVPIYAITAHALEGALEKCLSAGMDGWLTKPIQPKVLKQIMHEIGSGESARGHFQATWRR